MERLMKVDEVAARWRVSRMTVYRMVKAGSLPCVKLGPRSIRIPEAAVEEYENGAMGV